MDPRPSTRGPRPMLRLLAIGLGLWTAATPAFAVQPRSQEGLLHKEFFRPELYISNSHQELEQVIDGLPNKAAWQSFLTGRPDAVKVYIDPRSGAVTNIIGSTPLLPGSGVGNSVTLAALGQKLGRAVARVDDAVVA